MREMVPVPARLAGLWLLAVTLAAVSVIGQSAPPAPLRLVTAAGTQPLRTVMAGDIEMIALDDLAAVFRVDVREDTLARAFTVSYQGKTIVLSQDQALASIAGRLVSLPAGPAQVGGRWHVPVEFIGRALSAIYGEPLDLRKSARLIVQGNLRVPRVIVRHDVAGNQARLTLDVTPATPHQIVQEGGRLLVRFEADLLDLQAPPIRSQGFVESLRLADPPTAVAVELGARFSSFRGADTPLSPSGVRITLDIFGAPEQTAAPSPGAPGSPSTPSIPPSTPAVPSLGPPGLKTIVVDAGHGGDDGGARGAGGTEEKAVTLSVARLLKAALESRLGARVLMTRDEDRLVGLDERAAVANNNKADLFVSLHANASLRGAASGAEVFSLAIDPGDEAVRQVMGSQGVAMPVFGGGTREIDVILWEMAQARHVDDSAALARRVEAQLRSVVPMSPRALQRAPLRVLVGANMPAVLVEMGYLTNARQEGQLASADFQKGVANALTEAIAGFFATRTAPQLDPAVGAQGAGR